MNWNRHARDLSWAVVAVALIFHAANILVASYAIWKLAVSVDPIGWRSCAVLISIAIWGAGCGATAALGLLLAPWSGRWSQKLDTI
jgi:hypothetical protein